MGSMLMALHLDLERHLSNSSKARPEDRLDRCLIRTMRIANVAFSTVGMNRACSSSSADILDDLPIIRENIKKGFFETQNTVNKWVNNLKKRIDGEDEDDFQARSAPAAQGYIPQDQYGGRRSNEFGRRSADRERYDADPQVLGDDFAGLQLHDAEGTVLGLRLCTATC